MSQGFFWRSEGSEDMHKYRPGGFHPVHLGDRYPIGEPRYQVFDKLGYGSFSTVWLAEDLRSRRMVALKITIADKGYINHEIALLKSLPRSPYILNIFDSFTIVGPNGKHDVLVTEVLLFAKTVRFSHPKKFEVKTAAHEVLKGLAFLHENGVVHGELHPMNIAFRVPQLAEMSAKEWRIRLAIPDLVPILPHDPECENSPSLPKYVVHSFRLRGLLARDGENWPAVIADFGAAYSYRDPSLSEQKYALAPLAIRPPEQVLILGDSGKYPEMSNGNWGMQGDVWSAACTIYEMLHHIHLFAYAASEPALLCDMQKMIGILPPYLRHLLSDTDLSKSPPPRKEEADGCQLSDLLDLMLKYDPSQRPSARQLLDHPYFSQSQASAGSS